MKINPKKHFIFFLFLLLVLSFLFVNQTNVLATESIVPEISNTNCKCDKPSDACREYCGDYTLNDAVSVFITISQLILGLTGSIALLAFIVGGVMFLISSGNKNLIEKGKSTILGAVIGLVIVFTSYMIIGFLLTSFDVAGAKNWYKIGGLLDQPPIPTNNSPINTSSVQYPAETYRR